MLFAFDGWCYLVEQFLIFAVSSEIFVVSLISESLEDGVVGEGGDIFIDVFVHEWFETVKDLAFSVLLPCL